jgi:hypothetical protein
MPKHERNILIIAVFVLAVLLILGETPFSNNKGLLLGDSVSNVKLVAVTTSPVTSELHPSAPIYTDIPVDHPNATALAYLKSHNIMGGYPDGSFGPDKTINRAEIVKTIMGVVSMPEDTSSYKNCFSDVHEEWFAKYVCYAKSKGWIGGYQDGTFAPAKEVTRVEALKIIIAAYGLPLELNPYGDFSSLPPELWYSKYVWTADKNGLMKDWKNNTPGNLVTKATRLEVATAIYRLAFGNVPTV